MTTRQALEIAALFVLCLVSLRTFWRGEGFSASKKLGLALAVVVFAAVTLLILH
jgi:hypothetical protein